MYIIGFVFHESEKPYFFTYWLALTLVNNTRAWSMDIFYKDVPHVGQVNAIRPGTKIVRKCIKRDM